MAAFINNAITQAGIQVMAKGIAGQEIRYTRIVLGSGYLPEGTTPSAMTGVVIPIMELDINNITVPGDGYVNVYGVMSNSQVETGFFFREIALYALDPDPNIGEICYCYGNTGDFADFIPATGGADVIEKVIEITTVIGAATNITAYIASDAYATKDDIAKVMVAVKAAHDRADEAWELANQAIQITTINTADIIELRRLINSNTTRLDTLWDAVFGEITTNPFQIYFTDLQGITLNRGNWNAPNAWLECTQRGEAG